MVKIKKFLRGGKGTTGTLKAFKNHKNEKRNRLSSKVKNTLGSGQLYQAVILPPGEDREDWLASNVVDFYNEISLLYGLCMDDAERFTQPGEGFPDGVEYRWADMNGKISRVSSRDYVVLVMDWMEALIDTEEVFPESADQSFPADFEAVYIKDMFKKMIRIFAIMYHVHFANLKEINAEAHLNTVFKHFIFFVLEFDIVDKKEMEVLKSAIRSVEETFEKNKKDFLEGKKKKTKTKKSKKN